MFADDNNAGELVDINASMVGVLQFCQYGICMALEDRESTEHLALA